MPVEQTTHRGVTRAVALVSLALWAGGCASYAVPGSGANLRALAHAPTPQERAEGTDPSVAAMMDRKPLASFPATVAIVRVQGSDYTGRTVELYGRGAYQVVLTHDVEKPEQLERLGHLPMLAGLEPVNRLELPENLTGADDLRRAAAMLHADMVLIYTFDDDFKDRDNAAGATLLTLGIAPTKSLTVTSTASAVLIDTRNGYVYGAAEAMERKTTIANDWGETAAADACREETETAAFGKLVGDVSHMWDRVVAQYAPPAVPGGAATRPAGG